MVAAELLMQGRNKEVLHHWISGTCEGEKEGSDASETVERRLHVQGDQEGALLLAPLT
jgi:hypothetical protein